jgi:hypothetical protein
MNAVSDKIKSGAKVATEITVGIVTGLLDLTSNGIGLLSSLVKGEKKINIKIEETK